MYIYMCCVAMSIRCAILDASAQLFGMHYILNSIYDILLYTVVETYILHLPARTCAHVKWVWI